MYCCEMFSIFCSDWYLPYFNCIRKHWGVYQMWQTWDVDVMPTDCLWPVADHLLRRTALMNRCHSKHVQLYPAICAEGPIGWVLEHSPASVKPWSCITALQWLAQTSGLSLLFCWRQCDASCAKSCAACMGRLPVPAGLHVKWNTTGKFYILLQYTYCNNHKQCL